MDVLSRRCGCGAITKMAGPCPACIEGRRRQAVAPAIAALLSVVASPRYFLVAEGTTGVGRIRERRAYRILGRQGMRVDPAYRKTLEGEFSECPDAAQARNPAMRLVWCSLYGPSKHVVVPSLSQHDAEVPAPAPYPARQLATRLLPSCNRAANRAIIAATKLEVRRMLGHQVWEKLLDPETRLVVSSNGGDLGAAYLQESYRLKLSRSDRAFEYKWQRYSAYTDGWEDVELALLRDDHIRIVYQDRIRRNGY